MEHNNNQVEAFISRWQGADGSELANAQSFTRELCELLGVSVPDPARADTRDNAYVFERRIIFSSPDGSTSEGRIDCFKRGAFVLESKKLKQGEHTKGFGVAMLAAYKQAEQYARALPANEGWPPFILVVDVGNVIEIFSEFTCSGRTYTAYPDPRSHRIKLDNLRDEKVRERLRAIWLDPLSLDPAKQSAKVTREIAAQLAEIAKSLEQAGYDAERVGAFLTRCLFTFFAEDVGLLPKRAFTELLESLAKAPDQFVPMLSELWQAMDTGRFSVALRINVLHFNGKLFKNPDVLPLNRDQIDLLVLAGTKDWSQVEPAIFGTLLERALNPTERHSLGAHYTPRSYVERLVLPAVIDPLREEWSTVQTTALTLATEGNVKAAENVLRTFQLRLCSLRILDPACGSANFLYVTLEHLKRLEGEVLNQLHDLNVSMSLETEGLTVDPHQFLGIELNPRAASIAEMVLWIGYLQWHFKTKGSAQPPQPVLRDFKNIECRDAVLAYDSKELLLDESGKPVTRWDGKTYKKHPVTGENVPDENAQAPTYRYINPRKAEWPQADFIVGNPPFIGASRMIFALGEGYVGTLRKTWPEVPESCDLVMYWWHKAADLLCSKQLQRFGFITTNSLRQTFNRRVLELHMNSKQPLSLAFAIPDHPWVDNADGAAVRIAMTVAGLDVDTGTLVSIESEKAGDGDEPELTFTIQSGLIHADLRVGANVASSKLLISNSRLGYRGVTLMGSGFWVEPDDDLRSLEPNAVKPLRNGKDLTDQPRGVYAVDFFGLSELDARVKFPFAFQRVLHGVKPERDQSNRDSYREKWWLFAEARPDLRAAKAGLSRYLATAMTAKHRVFMQLESEILPDQGLIVIAVDDAYIQGVLSSKVHVLWALATGGTLENRPRYNNTRCFETFPFPEVNAQTEKVRVLAEQLDSHRKRQQSQYSNVTITGMYNVLEKLKTGEALTSKEKAIHEQGLVSVLKQLHDELDHSVLDAYGWWDLHMLLARVNGERVQNYARELPTAGVGIDVALATIPDDRDEALRLLNDRILERLVSLNHQRFEDEKKGIINWLRPEYQNPQGTIAASTIDEQTELAMDGEDDTPIVASTAKQPWPKGDLEQVKAVADLVAASKSPLNLESVAACFSGKGQWKKRLPNILEMLVVVGKARVDERGYVAV
jgi:hypothetical protein